MPKEWTFPLDDVNYLLNSVIKDADKQTASLCLGLDYMPQHRTSLKIWKKGLK